MSSRKGAGLFEKCTFGLMMMFVASVMATAQVRIDSGLIEGATGADSHVRVFKGIPFAAPPVRDLRWQAPQPVAHWDGVRKATEFGLGVCRVESSPTWFSATR